MYNYASKILRKDRGKWLFLFSILLVFLMCSNVYSQSMPCEKIKAKLNSLKQLKLETAQELRSAELTPAERSRLLQQLKQIGAQISSTQRSLDLCLKAPPAPPASVKAPQNILEIQYKNPDPPSDPNWAKTPGGIIPGSPGTFPYPPSDKEWKQVLAPDDEYDLTLVGASGWAINPRLVAGDVPPTHPFGFDWEFDFALDSQYAFLLADPGNKESEDSNPVKRAKELQIPVPDGGFLGVEWDKGLVPQGFLPGGRHPVNTGDRVAVFGRWILDTGHSDGGLRTEIHPPLLMACASPKRKSDGSPDPLVTRVLFTSRAYLVGQTFTEDTKDIYNDGAEDDGHLFHHLANEVAKVNSARSLLVEAHAKIKSHPFLGVHLAHFVIRPPSPQPVHSPNVPPKLRLAVSFHFTVRSGCAVQVTSTTTDAVDVFIALNNVGYIPPPLPNRRERTIPRDELSRLDPNAGTGYLAAEAISAAIQYFALGSQIVSALVAAILEQGMEIDEYDALKNVNILDSNNAVTNVSADKIPAGMGISKDDSQPFPVYGWIDVKWVEPVLHK